MWRRGGSSLAPLFSPIFASLAIHSGTAARTHILGEGY